MMRYVFALGVAAAAIVAAPFAHGTDDDDWFRSVASFRLAATFNVPGATSAEIASATPDGNFIVYSDAIGQLFGLVDIRNPRRPVQLGTLAAGGDPTSVAVLPDGGFAVGCVQPGKLILIDLSSFTKVAEKSIGTGPDSVAVTRVGSDLIAVIAIENEGTLGKGYIEIVRLNLADFSNSSSAIVSFDDAAALSAAGLIAVDDPQPEFVSIQGTRAAVTLQENNGIAIVDFSDPAHPTLETLFSAGVVSNRPADLLDDSRISLSQTYPADVLASVPTAGARVPDAIAWSGNGATLFTADEGESNFTGGRGWSARTSAGQFLFDDGGTLEAAAVRFGHYPDGRSDAKGIEAESLATAKYGRREFLFVGSERGAFVAVYRIEDGMHPRFVQLLPTGQAPEGILAIASRGLLITANEGDDADGTISIFEGVSGPWVPPIDRPTIFSAAADEPWGALSGLAASRERADILYAVPDNALPSSIFSVDTGAPFARIRERAAITRDGVRARYDLEGIAIDTSIARPAHGAGFWLASEGNTSTTRNMLVQVNANGAMLREIVLPADVDAPGRTITSNGFEGVAVSSNGRYLLVAVQRPYSRERLQDTGLPQLYTRIARYDLLTERWEAFFYPLENAPFTIGLSEITLLGTSKHGEDLYAVIERDNQLAFNGTFKRVYVFSLEGLAPHDISTPVSAASIVGSTVEKALLRDVRPEFAPYEKVEGLAVTRAGDLWVALDNDGGEFESRLVRYRRVIR